LNIQKIGKGDATCTVEDTFPGNVLRIKIITVTEGEFKVYYIP